MARQRRVVKVPDPKAYVALDETATHQEWLAERKKSIGGSDIAAIAGCSKWSTPLHVFCAKADGWQGAEFEGNVYTKWGQLLEPVILREAADRLHLALRPGGQIWRHLDVPYVHVTPDGFLTRRRSWRAETIVEAKTSSDSEGWSDGVGPLHYRAQLQVQMHLLGIEVGYLACLEMTPDRNFWLCEVKYDREWAEELVEAARRFWTENVIPGEPPMADVTHPKTEELLRNMHPAVVEKSVDLPEDITEWIDLYFQAREDLARSEKVYAKAKNMLLWHIGDAAAGYYGERKLITYPEVRTKRIDQDKLRERYPEIADECTITSVHRRLTVKKPHEK